jgi:hypothetical protein
VQESYASATATATATAAAPATGTASGSSSGSSSGSRGGHARLPKRIAPVTQQGAGVRRMYVQTLRFCGI